MKKNIWVRTSALVLALASVNAMAAPPFVCSTHYAAYEGTADFFGTVGHVTFTLTSGSHCTGQNAGTKTLCGQGATDATCSRTNLTEAALLQVNSSLAAAAANGTRIDLYMDLCDVGNALNCLSGVGFRADQ